jgi:hypothetical protein
VVSYFPRLTNSVGWAILAKLRHVW